MKKQPVSKQPPKKTAPKTTRISDPSSPEKKQYFLYGMMVMLFLISTIVFSPILNNGFISTWDDGPYVLQNQLLHNFSWQGITKIFSYGDTFQQLTNNYHPLTTLSLALDYQVSGLSPSAYHTTNLILHGLNAVLAFLFVYLLFRRRIWPAVITGLLFAVHPMHVESVAWISERKDVLYAFFFLAGLNAYLKYLEDEKTWKLGVALLLFIFSCLSKAMAVPFPIILLLIDYLQRRKLSWKPVVEKIPFFIIALVIGYMSVHLQSFSAINKFETFTLYQRIMHASYGFIGYFIRFFIPSGLSAFYPYPAITPDGLLPLSFRIAPYVCLSVAALLAWISTRKGEIPRTIVFGVLFFFFTIALVLQFLSVGKAIMADRYTYIPYIGLSIIIGMVVEHFICKKSPLNYIGYGLAGLTLIMVVIFSFITHERTRVWKDDISIWSDALMQYPDGRMNFIYEKRARQFLDRNQSEAAMADYQTILANDPRDDNALEAVGRMYGKYYHDLGKSVEYLEKAYSINPKNPEVLKGLGVVMGMKGEIAKSLDYLLQAYQLDQADTILLRNISAGYNYMNMPAKAKEFDQLARSLRSKQAIN